MIPICTARVDDTVIRADQICMRESSELRLRLTKSRSPRNENHRAESVRDNIRVVMVAANVLIPGREFREL